MGEFFDWNPDRGTWYEVSDHNGGIAIHTKQDVQPVLDHAKAIRNSGLNERKMRKTGFLHYATIPAHVELEIMQNYGVKSIYKKDFQDKLLKIIDQEYPYLKCTDMKHQ